jgi:hypothetical protein
MPLLESRESRNRRLLNEAVAGLLQAMAGLAPDEAAYKTHSSWVCGGSVTAALAVTDVDALKRLWGKGDERRALALLEVSTYPMISRWYRNLERQQEVAEDQRQLARRIAATNISNLFGSRSEQLLDDFMKMDRQFSYERDWMEEARPGIPLVEAHLLLSRVLLAWGHPSLIDWPKITLPADLVDLLEQIGEFDPCPLRDILTLNWALLDGETAMYVYYRSL